MARTVAAVAGHLFSWRYAGPLPARGRDYAVVNERERTALRLLTLRHRLTAFTGERFLPNPDGELQSSVGDNSEERVDYYHAVAQLKAALDAAYGENDPRGQAQFKKLRHVLLEEENGAEKIIRALRYLRRKHPRRKRVREVLGYFRRHRRRMDYAQAVERGLPIGSGVVEAACKTLATQRLKRSGMRWRRTGGQAILTLRALVQSNRFDHAWYLLSESYRVEVALPDNVIELPSRCAA